MTHIIRIAIILVIMTYSLAAHAIPCPPQATAQYNKGTTSNAFIPDLNVDVKTSLLNGDPDACVIHMAVSFLNGATLLDAASFVWNIADADDAGLPEFTWMSEGYLSGTDDDIEALEKLAANLKPQSASLPGVTVTEYDGCEIIDLAWEATTLHSFYAARWVKGCGYAEPGFMFARFNAVVINGITVAWELWEIYGVATGDSLVEK